VKSNHPRRIIGPVLQQLPATFRYIRATAETAHLLGSGFSKICRTVSLDEWACSFRDVLGYNARRGLLIESTNLF